MVLALKHRFSQSRSLHGSERMDLLTSNRRTINRLYHQRVLRVWLTGSRFHGTVALTKHYTLVDAWPLSQAVFIFGPAPFSPNYGPRLHTRLLRFNHMFGSISRVQVNGLS
jgi:hypothetical protein